jgi:hypothetical protein
MVNLQINIWFYIIWVYKLHNHIVHFCLATWKKTWKFLFTGLLRQYFYYFTDKKDLWNHALQFVSPEAKQSIVPWGSHWPLLNECSCMQSQCNITRFACYPTIARKASLNVDILLTLPFEDSIKRHWIFCKKLLTVGRMVWQMLGKTFISFLKVSKCLNCHCFQMYTPY